MRFDDRLLTVLNLPPGDRHDRAVRWRQLVDLVARSGSSSDSPVVADALKSIRADAEHVDEALRAAAARAVAALPLPLGLLEYFAADKLAVSAPVLAAATLEPDQWRALAAVADTESRRFIETLHPQATGAEPGFTETLVEPQPTVGQETAQEPAGPSLSEVVARIERRRRKRTGAAPHSGASTGAEGPSLFRWECGPSGEIAWVEGAPRGPLIGRSIARNGAGAEPADEQAARAFARRAPFRDSVLRLGSEGPLSGEWKISGVPAFDPADGRFAGYRGIALREVYAPFAAEVAGEFLADPDSLRELVHEIKTPLNAIMGFAEIIDGQYLGPADRRYRKRALDIVAQAKLLLAAIDDLDFAAKIHSAKSGAPPRVDLLELIEHGAPSLRALAAEHGAQLEIARAAGPCLAAVAPELADRLVARLCSALAERAAAGETLRLSLDRAGQMCLVAIGVPEALRGLSESQVFESSQSAQTAQAARADHPPGQRDGFALRLVRGLARIAGGDLIAARGGFTLAFPHA